MKILRTQFTDCKNPEPMEKEVIILDDDTWKDEPILLDIDRLRCMSSGTCIISPCQDNPIAICKEGHTIKIFKICIEEIAHSDSGTEDLLVSQG